ncbi:DUF3306 domain-containing protein [Massilia alkalitolerans]|uniref:DUF3306 domain-containing protein n=1 Tax=Massilia alkalitolerans TaxID=286638 RepID=UPI00146FA721|nr:DUF3306 domain-containing protein [Massilia alkalitolerans]
MSEEGFFRRWARLKSSGGDAAPAEGPRAPAPPVPASEPPADAMQEAQAAPRAPLPTLEDAARLTPDADFSAFVAKGVDQSVRRLALKKLFADPHFNAIDGLDIYMNDYNKAAPLTPAMLASLKHAQGLVTRLFDDRQQQAEAAAAQAQEQQPVTEHEQAPPSTRQGNA